MNDVQVARFAQLKVIWEQMQDAFLNYIIEGKRVAWGRVSGDVCGQLRQLNGAFQLESRGEIDTAQYALSLLLLEVRQAMHDACDTGNAITERMAVVRLRKAVDKRIAAIEAGDYTLERED